MGNFLPKPRCLDPPIVPFWLVWLSAPHTLCRELGVESFQVLMLLCSPTAVKQEPELWFCSHGLNGWISVRTEVHMIVELHSGCRHWVGLMSPAHWWDWQTVACRSGPQDALVAPVNPMLQGLQRALITGMQNNSTVREPREKKNKRRWAERRAMQRSKPCLLPSAAGSAHAGTATRLSGWCSCKSKAWKGNSFSSLLSSWSLY